MFLENTFDFSHTTAFSERLYCSSDFANRINQSLSFSLPSLEESQIHQSQVGGWVLAVTASYAAELHRTLKPLIVESVGISYSISLSHTILSFRILG